ncbi:AIG2-like protein D [Ranunculus cassubicifolius]
MGSATTTSTLHSIFVYGSLQADQVVTAILKRIPQSSPAILHGYHRFSIKGRIYPAIIPVQDKNVHGKVLFGITDPELDILDAFEDVEYERNTVNVSLTDTLETVECDVYVWKDKLDPDLYGEWHLEEWKKVHMNDFVKMTCTFMEELPGPESKPRVETYETFYHHHQSENSSMP